MDPEERAALKAEIRAEVMAEVHTAIWAAIGIHVNGPDPTAATPIGVPGTHHPPGWIHLQPISVTSGGAAGGLPVMFDPGAQR